LNDLGEFVLGFFEGVSMQENLENLDECLEDGSAEWTLIYNA